MIQAMAYKKGKFLWIVKLNICINKNCLAPAFFQKTKKAKIFVFNLSCIENLNFSKEDLFLRFSKKLSSFCTQIVSVFVQYFLNQIDRSSGFIATKIINGRVDDTPDNVSLFLKEIHGFWVF